MSVAALRETFRRDRVFDFMHDTPRHPVDVSQGVVLYLEDISVSFDGSKAIDNLNLYIQEGELRCIIGPNGAGKTTLMDIITGKTRPDSGTAWFGRNMNLLTMDEPAIAQAGIGRKFQKPTVFEQLSVEENLELSMTGSKRIWSTLTATISREQQDHIDEVLTIIGLENVRATSSSTPSHGRKQWLEIGMLIMQKPKLLLIDEPAAGMTPQEMERTIKLLNSLAGRHSLVVVEHDMKFVRAIAQQVTVLHQGSVLAEGDMQTIQSDSRVIDVYLGASNDKPAQQSGTAAC